MIGHVIHPAALVDDPGYSALKDHVIATTGLAYYDDKDGDLAERLLRRLRESGAPDCAGYLELLADPARGEPELDQLTEELTIGETSFFRHMEMFEGLRSVVLPAVVARAHERRQLRIWSAGCSIGAEPYSIAILLRREFGIQIADWNISIVGTDINRRFLSRARVGRFKNWDFRNAPSWLLNECFTREGDEWAIDPRHTEWVSFQYHNLARHAFPSLIHNLLAFDLILCRNVIIYFDAPIVQRMIAQFRDCLVDGGWLLVGHSEPNLDTYRAFQTVNVPGAVLYQKRDTSAQSAPPPQGPSRTSERRTALPAPACPAGTNADCGRSGAQAAKKPPSAPDAANGDDAVAGMRQLADAGCLNEAATRCRKLIAQDQKSLSSHLFLAMLLEQMGRHAEAEAAIRCALSLDRGSAMSHYVFAQIQNRMGRPDVANQAYRTALGLIDGLSDETVIPDGDDMTVADLKVLAALQLEVHRK